MHALTFNKVVSCRDGCQSRLRHAGEGGTGCGGVGEGVKGNVREENGGGRDKAGGEGEAHGGDRAHKGVSFALFSG